MVLNCLRVVISQSSRYCFGRGLSNADQIQVGYVSSGCKIGSFPSLNMFILAKGSPILTCLREINQAAGMRKKSVTFWTRGDNVIWDRFVTDD